MGRRKYHHKHPSAKEFYFDSVKRFNRKAKPGETMGSFLRVNFGPQQTLSPIERKARAVFWITSSVVPFHEPKQMHNLSDEYHRKRMERRLRRRRGPAGDLLRFFER